MAKQPDQGLSGAHTREDSTGPAAPGGNRPEDLDLDAAVRQLAEQIEPEAEQFDLLAEPPEPVGSLENIAENTLAERRARGRPKGASNKRNAQVFDYLEHIGHRDPVTTLSMIQSMDPAELAKALQCKRKDATALIISAAEKLLPYKYAKRPTEIAVTGEGGKGRPFMVIGEMNVAFGGVSDDGFMSAGQARGKTVEYQDVSEAETVRHDGEAPHETVKPLKKNDD